MISMVKRLNKQKGDTLLDIVFSLAILSIILVVAYGSAIFSWRTARTAQQRTQAYYLAQYQTEALIAYKNANTWAFIIGPNGLKGKTFYMKKSDNCTPNCTWVPVIFSNPLERKTWDPPLDIYTVKVVQTNDRSDIVAEDPNRILRFRVDVKWTDPNNTKDTVSTATYLTNTD